MIVPFDTTFSKIVFQKKVNTNIIRITIIDLYVNVPAYNNCIYHKANYVDHNSDAVYILY